MGKFSFGRKGTIYRFAEGETTRVTQRGDDLSQPSSPTAEVGINVPYVIGTTRVFKPNVIWNAAVEPIVETTKTKEKVNCREEATNSTWWDVYVTVTCDELITTTKTIVGYTLPICFGICLGPDVTLNKIFLDERTIRTLPANFGGTSSNNPRSSYTKYIGDFLFFDGSFDQPKMDSTNPGTADPVVLTFYGLWTGAYETTAVQTAEGFWFAYKEDPPDFDETDVEDTESAWPGICYIYFPEGDLVNLTNAKISFEVDRRPNPLGLATSRNEIGKDINIASAIYDFLTTSWGGMGISTDRIDLASFQTAASIFYDESNAVSYQITQPTTAKNILDMLLDQAQAIVYENPSTGKIEIKAIRYSLFSDTTTFALTENNVERLDRWERQSWAQTFNKLVLTYTDRTNKYREASLVAFNFASEPESIAEDRSVKRSYPACMSTATARQLLKREMLYLSQPKILAEVTADRTAADLLPGDPVSLNLPRHGVATFVGYVQKVARTGLVDNKVKVTIEQVVRDDLEIDYGDPDVGIGTVVQLERNPPTALRVYQTPYWFVFRFNLISILDTYTQGPFFPYVFPTRADRNQSSFRTFVDNEPDVGIMQIIADGQYPTVARISSAIDKYDNFDTMIIPSLTLQNVNNSEFLESVGTAGIDNGEFFLWIGNEIMTCSTVTDNGDGTFTLTNVHRMVLDTAPESHASLATCYIFGNQRSNIGNIESIPLGYTPSYRTVSRVAGFLDDYGDETDSNEYYESEGSLSTTPSRVARPIRPINPSITTDGLGDGAYGRPTSIDDDARIIGGQAIAVTWKNRSRDTPTVPLFADASENIEQDYGTGGGVTEYHRNKITIIDADGDEFDCPDDTAGTSATTTSLSTTVATGPDEGLCSLVVKATNSVGDSLYHEELVVIKFDSGWFITEDDTFEWITEDGSFIWAGE